ncbi:MAG: tRNA 4-thiouridine(8) synthase ThiI, partial [archaeon]|nr:tRNA 4-thiouridine(8) synthase ThiI [archaeon]
LDKVEITRMAEEIGTFEISKRDDGGCSAVPRYPETKADLEAVYDAQEAMNQEEEIQKAFESIEW